MSYPRINNPKSVNSKTKADTFCHANRAKIVKAKIPSLTPRKSVWMTWAAYILVKY